ncbi:MAG: cell division protein FtsQ [Lachnospiraceae bacterium]|nr:cell division protein FtsQ [Lachnospiraceae bacterium]
MMTTNQKVTIDKKWVVLAVIFAMIIITVMGVLSIRIQNVNVVGNEQCSNEEVRNHILSGNMSQSTVVVWFKSRFGKKANIPFVQKYDIEFNSMSEITINIYEKSLVGYIDYMGTYMYFDKDGIVVESSENKIDGIPKITGISFDYVLLHEKLPVDNDKVFNTILNLTQTLKKNELPIDKIHVNEKMESILYIKKVKVLLGDNKDLSEKITELKDIFMSGKLKNQSGTLDITSVNREGTGYILKTEDKKAVKDNKTDGNQESNVQTGDNQNSDNQTDDSQNNDNQADNMQP